MKRGDKMKKTTLKMVLATCLMLAAPFYAWAEESADFQKLEIKAEALADNIYFIYDNAGMGNMAACEGADGLFIIDTKSVFLSELLKATLAQISSEPVKYLLNSHCHFDHVDGNRAFMDTATIIAHKVTYDYMLEPQELAVFGGDPYPALTPETGLPNVTFADVLDLYINNTRTQMVYLGPRHTGGDVVTIFTNENIMHLGDLMFNGMYPFIDINHGGSINSMIETAAKVAELMDDETVIIPGHGPLSNKAQFLEWYAMLAKVRDNVAKAIADGKTMEETIALKPTQEFDAVYGEGGPLSIDQFVELCYMDLIRFK